MMPKLIEARTLEEDWTGLKDAKARRKLQNRLNVRAHRRRKQNKEDGPERNKLALVSMPRDSSTQSEEIGTTTRFGSAAWQTKSRNMAASDYSILNSPFVRRFIEANCFPLSGDNLIPLLQFNVLRGIFTNLSILGLLHTVPDECHSASGLMPLFPAPGGCPEALVPTALQRVIPHEAWIDTLPDPRMRDNALRLMSEIDEEDLMRDLVGKVCQGQNCVEITSILVWQDPWSTDGWEMTPGFVEKWGRLVKGCSRLLESTNRHRARRGEAPLIVEI